MAARKKTMALGILAGMLALTSATAFGDTGKDTSASPTKTVQAAPASEPGAVRVIEDKATVSEPIGNTAEELQALTGMELAAENETFALYVNKTKGDIALKDKRSGFVWFSNPPGRERDPKASPQYKADMASQFVLTYYNDKGQTNNFNSFDDSVSKKQFQIEKEENGIKVTYQLGKITKTFNNIPQAISKKDSKNKFLTKSKSRQNATTSPSSSSWIKRRVSTHRTNFRIMLPPTYRKRWRKSAIPKRKRLKITKRMT
ncbi:hypothetical protein N6H14_20200 [Paenibacillus sp. CC-CFT747]|nr:hypothetical protein N6H14_20200 [Paenibacillus sp. CC-CFT747]